MSAQIFVLNGTHHCLILKVHKPRTLKWLVGSDSSYSWSLPIDADCETRYKIKHDGHRVAYVWINHNGLITRIENHSKKFHVTTDEDDLDEHRCGYQRQPTIYICGRRHRHC